MKTTVLLLSIFCFSLLTAGAQDAQDIRLPMLGDPAPSFTAQSTLGTIHFPADYYQKWKILFSHPGDFTPVCSTEILELAAMQHDFDKLGARLVVISTDGLNSHIEWVRSLESIKYHDKGPYHISFPIVTDATLEVSKKYGMINPKQASTKDVRGVFIIDPQDRIQAMFFYPNITGRNMDEIKRTLQALQKATADNVLTPANWTPGQPVLLQAPKSPAEAKKLLDSNDPDLVSLAWYLWFKGIP